MPRFSRPFRRLSELHAERLASFETMWRSGVAIAAPAALQYCAEHKVRPPPWVLETALELLCDLLKREKSNRRGRSCGYLARYRQDMIDFARWCEVKDTRERQMEIRHQVEEMRTFPNVPRSYSEDRKKMLAWVGSTLNRAYECAAMLLKGSDAYASPDAIKKSYFTVERNSKDPRHAFRYHLLDHSFLAKVGLEDCGKAPAGTKWHPMYKLTL